MVTRWTEGGDTLGLEQTVSVMDAIKAYTINGAYASFDEDRIGRIEPCKLADLVVISGDILGCAEEEIKELRVVVTMLAGKIVYREES